MKNLLYLVGCVCLFVSLSGCSSNSSGQSGFSCFKNRPFRTKFQSCFGGAPCNTCSPPAGQPANCGTNVAPLCDSCGVNGSVTPGVSLYSETGLNGPINNQIIQNPSPIYPEGAIQGGMDSGSIQPPMAIQ